MNGRLNAFGVVSGNAVPRILTEEGGNRCKSRCGIVALNGAVDLVPAPAESQFIRDIALAGTAQFMDRDRFRKALW
jgi:hypothetical protein